MGGSSSSTAKDEDGMFSSSMCCMRSRNRPSEETVSHLSWHRSSLRASNQGKPGPPEGIVKLSEITHNSVVLTWLSPLDRGLGQILAYHVEKSSYRDKKWQTATETCQGTSYKVRDLVPNTKYLFRVRAENMLGVSRPGLESDPIVLPSLNLDDLNNLDAPTTFSRRGSNFIDSDSGVKTLVTRSIGPGDNLDHWSFPRQQSRKRTSLDAVLKRNYSTGHRRSASGFRDSKQVVKENPLFVDNPESPRVDPDKTISLNIVSCEEEIHPVPLINEKIPLVENNNGPIVSENYTEDEELEMVVIVTKDMVPFLDKLTSQKSESEVRPASPNKELKHKQLVLEKTQSFPCAKHPTHQHEEMFEYELDETGAKIPLNYNSTQGRINVRKPLHAKLFVPLGEDSAEEHETFKENSNIGEAKVSVSEDEFGTDQDDIKDVVKSLTSLYHSQVSLCDTKPEAQPDKRDVTPPPPKPEAPIQMKPENPVFKRKVEPDVLTSEYDGSASDSDEGRSTIPPVRPVFVETDSSQDDDPTDTSVSSFKDGLTTDTEQEREDDSDSDLSLTDYFGDESDDSADIDSWDEKPRKQKESEKTVLRTPDTSDDEALKRVPSVTQVIDVQVHSVATPVTKKRHRAAVVEIAPSESDSIVGDSVRVKKPPSRSLKNTPQTPSAAQSSKQSPESSDVSSTKVDSLSSVADIEQVHSEKNQKSIESFSEDVCNKTAEQEVESKCRQSEEVSLKQTEINSEACQAVKATEESDLEDDLEAPVTPPGSDEGVDMDTMSDTEVVIIHSTEVMDQLQALMAKDPKLADILSNHPQFKNVVGTKKVTKEKLSKDPRPKVTFADQGKNKY